MLVEQIMKTPVITLQPTNTIAEAIQLVRQRRIRHIPIVDGDDHVVGIVTDRDIRDASPSIFHFHEHLEDLQKPISTIMKTEVIVGHPLDFVEEVAALFYEHKISCLPIVKDRKLVGIVTETDLLYTLIQLTGAHQPGTQIEIKVLNESGMLSKAAAIIAKRNTNISSVLLYPAEEKNYQILVFRVQTMNPIGIINDLKNAGYTVLWPNLPGVSS
ncbi:acetoin utilization AcuB family protein [Parageobacillus thermoglucosidasius]|uniref:Acetoin utilization protein AcuB n=1 Tax=Parageobacillus thermoglucosidasius TaxID=1426 RepID=A0AAN1D8C1_PARTM|nr:acetoin utilization AcuB family protein [Parageobacillus thermoglucosidasius]REK59335.1 MAG: CBS domain-containing protein [Geobacillus sp.]ALF11833.1 acetoin utilization protein AcuB [Parageobacillus thermoglucosidasius]ANZ31917.1 acetoin utilization protein AcuB [Parageobacillus thermoglucosidasius]APM82651.1 acetoin utilization protein AcuB [Parageobacillus thermoglucosidasius]KJX69794.1 acetoin utilization protein AcuB [Parageobacillus thermoglucosidasius]